MKPKADRLSSDFAEWKLRSRLQKSETERERVAAELKVSEERLRAAEAKLRFVEFVKPERLVRHEIRPLRPKAGNEGCLICTAGDWHAYQVVRGEEVADRNSYNPPVCRRRVQNAFRGFARWEQIHRQAMPVTHLLLGFVGDLIANQIHPELLETNAGTPQEEVLFVVGLATDGIRYLVDNTKCEKLTIVCVDGNHGRSTEKTYRTNRSRHSFEWLLYHLIAREVARELGGRREIVFAIADGLHVYQEVFDRTIRYHHGDAIRYEGGVGGLTIPANKRIGRWNREREADLDIFGHFHTAFLGQRFLCNGSVVGYDPYAKWISAEYEPPTQSALLVEKRYGLTSYHKIYLD